MVTGSNNKTSLWITLTPETAELTCRTVADLHQALATVKQWAGAKWGFDEQAVGQIELTKLDVTMDFLGSLLPADPDGAYDAVKALLEDELGKIFQAPLSNFLSTTSLNDLQVSIFDYLF